LTGYGITINGEAFNQHPPLTYIIYSAFFAIFGFNEWIIKLVIALFGVGSVICAYYIGKELENIYAAIFAAVLTFSNYLFFFLSTRILNNIIETFFIISATLFFIRYLRSKKYSDLAICVALVCGSVLIRLSSLVLVIAFGIALLYSHKRAIIKEVINKKFIACLLPLVLTVIYLVASQILIPNFMERTLGGSTLDVAEWYYYIVNFVNIFGWQLVLVSAISIVLLLISTKLKPSKEMFVIFITIICYFIINSVWPVKEGRYIVALVPLLAVCASLLLAKISTYNEKNWIRYIVCSLLLIVVIVSSLPFAYLAVADKAVGFCGLEEIGTAMRGYTDNNENVISSSIMQLTWYADLNNRIYFPPSNITAFHDLVKAKNITYAEFDAWERTQPAYISEVINQSEIVDYYPHDASASNPVSIVVVGVQKQ